MASNEYHFITRWRVAGTVEEVYDIISKPLDYVRWWPEVYLAIKEIEPGGEGGVGRLIDLHTRGRLPYTLRWQARTTEVRKPLGMTIEAQGDFVGRGIWTFRQDGPEVDITFDWKLRADKALLRRLSFLLKPIFAANHRWAMARGEEDLRKELARRKQATRT